MFYSLVNLEGKTLESFRDESAAEAALRATVEANPQLAEEVLLLRNTDDGERAGAALMFEDLFNEKVDAGMLPAYAHLVGASIRMDTTVAFGYAVGLPRRLVGKELAIDETRPAHAAGSFSRSA
jgi:hypothetical protein